MFPPPIDPMRRRFLTVAVVASAISVAGLAAATTAPTAPQAVALPRLAPEDIGGPKNHLTSVCARMARVLF
jgi:hypothetical protein